MPVDPAKRAEVLEWMIQRHGESTRIVSGLRGSAIRVPFVSPLLTYATSGGVPMGHICRWYGPEGCLAEDTFLRYEIRKPTGERQNHKGGTIESLYLKFNSLNRTGQDVRQRKETIGSEFFLPSMNEEGRIFQNRIVGVVDSGLKECFKLRTTGGQVLVATADHKIFVGTGYKRLGDLVEGESVYLHNNTRFKTIDKPRIQRPETTVKHHPTACIKVVNGHEYRRVSIARLTAEATLNGMDLDEFRSLLNAGDLEGLEFLPAGAHVHHVDEDFLNNDPANLAVMIPTEHNRMHALASHNNLRFTVVEDCVESIVPAGSRHTYDVQMEAPHNNYIANGIVVHNSGKSLTNWGLILVAQRYPEYISLLYEMDIKHAEKRKKKLVALKKKKDLKELLKRFPNGMETILFDTEQRADLDFAEKLGVDVNRVEIIDENIIETIIEEMAAAVEAYHIVIIDSASNAESLKEANLEPGEYQVGGAAQAWPRLKGVRRKMDRQENIIIIVDQVRTQMEKLGRMMQTRVAPPNVRFLRHNSSLSIEYSQGSKLYLDSNGDLTDDYKKASNDFQVIGHDGKQVAGLEMRCFIAKNSTGAPFRHARMRFRFPAVDLTTGELVQEPGFDEGFELLESALATKIMERGGARYYVLDDKFERINARLHGKVAKSLNGGAQAIQSIMEDEELAHRIRFKLRQITLL